MIMDIHGLHRITLRKVETRHCILTVMADIICNSVRPLADFFTGTYLPIIVHALSISLSFGYIYTIMNIYTYLY